MDGMAVIQRVQLSGTITTQPMFSGVGYFIDGAMFGIDFDGLFYVKANGPLKQQCKQAGWQSYVYRNNQTIVTNYYALPEEYLHCPERLRSLITQVVAFAKFGVQSRLEKKERPTNLKDLPNMRQSTEVLLKRIGITSVEELREVGAAQAYVWIRDRLTLDVSERLLFRLEGALVQRHWMCLGETKQQTLIDRVLMLSLSPRSECAEQKSS
ncbi:TfoX/Sxy family DNA transformation protein [Vibrio mediterranei]|uniref:TfoX/Sxy family DNA transformation protein n=1 Tax=Vibrio mediterranei TaxID=689 RepID=UPI001EFED2B6|nr:TfoX/Sxy family DNA transformation protein [Vibrio mediterranei]MCG9657934.1 TfoX/Sxy family DNA transformation protein [Vibrio mediterranei]